MAPRYAAQPFNILAVEVYEATSACSKEKTDDLYERPDKDIEGKTIERITRW